jgi:hypothetical protein
MSNISSERCLWLKLNLWEIVGRYVNCINICVTHFLLKICVKWHMFSIIMSVWQGRTFFFCFICPWYKTSASARNDSVFVVKWSYHGQQMEKTLSFFLLLLSTLNSTEAMIDIIILRWLHVWVVHIHFHSMS